MGLLAIFKLEIKIIKKKVYKMERVAYTKNTIWKIRLVNLNRLYYLIRLS